MGHPFGYATPPGWYPDPWYPQSTRYWNGATWTEHAQWAGWRPWVDPTSVRKWGARTAIAFLIQAAFGALTALVGPVVYGSFFDDAFTNFETAGEPAPFDGGQLAANLLLQAGGLASLAVVIFLAVWGNHITTTARALGLRTTHSPGWAVAGWLVPILNLWFPYQIVRDALPEDDEARTLLGAWWALHISSQILGPAAMIAALFETGVGVAMGLVTAAAYLAAGLLGRRLALAIAVAHEAGASRLAGPAVAARL
jgi:hypothetical protein